MASPFPAGSLQDQAYGDAVAAGVPPNFFVQLIQDESSFNPLAHGPLTSSGRAEGIAQFMPGTAAQLGVDPWNPASALQGAAAYLAQLYKSAGSWLGAAHAYGTTTGAGAANVNNLTSALQQDQAGGAAGSPAANGAPNGGQQNCAFGDFNCYFHNVENWTLGVASSAVWVIVGIVLLGGALIIFANDHPEIGENVSKGLHGLDAAVNG